MIINKSVDAWVKEVSALTQPDEIVVFTASKEQLDALKKEAVSTGEIIELNQEKRPGCYYHRTAQNDVARVEDRTIIVTTNKEDAGPTNNWMSPEEAHEKMNKLYKGSMKGRTMYVIPYIMGPANSPFSKLGVEVTDSIYVVLNMNIMTRAGQIAIDMLGEDAEFVKGIHAKADVDPENRWIMHFPEEYTIMSVNSAYGGNVLLGKKCFALRIASVLGKEEGWMAEHMLILGIEDPNGKVSYIAAAFPSACGKTNLAMLIPPKKLADAGYKVWTVGDDIAWMRIGKDGKLYAVNPEAGFFGVAPGTSAKSNFNALRTCDTNTIFTNVAVTDDGDIWWESMGVDAPAHMTDWLGNDWTPESGVKAAHPNSRFTAPASQCPCISKEWENPDGVPISAILFGGRRAKTAPLVYQSFDWKHGTFVGATMASETTAAAAGAVGVVRRDPMAMLPFCGYNMGDYWAHWIEMGEKLGENAPKIFNVNWFRQDDEGHFIWPGYGENMRVLLWILDRVNGKADANETAIGYIPDPKDIDVDGLDIDMDTLKELLSIDKDAWDAEVKGEEEFFKKFDRIPAEIKSQFEALKERVAKL